MAASFGWAGQILRVNLTTGTITKESTDPYKDVMGGTGLAWKVMFDEVPPETKAFDPENKVIFSVGPVTGSGSPCSGRTNVASLWPVHGDELPSAGHMGGHWGPELKYAGYDAIIVEGESASPVWLRIEDDKVTLEDAGPIWGQGIYRATNYIVNLMGSEAHVAAIGQCGENQSRMGAVFCDRSHRAGGCGGILGKKKLKAIGVRGTGAVRIAMNKAEWRNLNKYYMNLIGANNQCVVARTLQPWSEHSPSGSRWSGAPGVKWGSALPPVDMGNCPDIEHPMFDAKYPVNKVGLRTQKGFNDFGEEGLKRTVRMDGCFACPIRCHIAADHPELENYGVSRYNMNTCAGNGILNKTFRDEGAMNPQQGKMLNAYMANHLEGDYGIWSDYSGWGYAWDFLFNYEGTHGIVADEYVPATVADTRPGAAAGATIPNPLIGQPLIRKYLSAKEWTAIYTTKLWSSGKSPLELMEAGDPRWNQYLGASMAANVPGTIGWFFGRGPAWMAKLGAETAAARAELTYTPKDGTPVVIRKELPEGYGLPELRHEMDVNGHLHIWKQGHTLHHSIEAQSQLGALLSTFQAARDMNNHTLQNFNTNGLPNSPAKPLKMAIAQEIACSKKTYFTVEDKSAQGEWAWGMFSGPTGSLAGYRPSPMNEARAGLAAQCIISYELENSLTQCNYTLPVWASPVKGRNYGVTENDVYGASAAGEPSHLAITPPGGSGPVPTEGYRGDPTLDVKVFNAVTGSSLSMAEYEKMGLKMYTLWRILVARIMSKRQWININGPAEIQGHVVENAGANMRDNFDQAPEWAFTPGNAVSDPGTLDRADWEMAKTLVYQQFGYEPQTGNPTEATLNDLGLGDAVPILKSEGIIP